jgi:hypothetical protein
LVQIVFTEEGGREPSEGKKNLEIKERNLELIRDVRVTLIMKPNKS